MMYLVVPLAVIVGIIWALVVFPSFRIVVFILVVLAAIVYFSASEKATQDQKQEQAQKDQEQTRKEQERVAFEARQKEYCQAEPKRWTIVSPSQIEIRGALLKEVLIHGLINDEFDLTASIKNKSKSKVTVPRLSVTALDCPTSDARRADCEIIGRGDGTFVTEIPGGEVRQINGKITMRDVAKPRGMFSPKFAVNAVRAPLDESDDVADNDLIWWWGRDCESANERR
jgi:Tfp pilus assembly protein PilE